MEPRETSGVTVHAIVRHVREQGGEQAVRRVLELAGGSRDTDAYLDKRRWWSYDTKISLFTAAAHVLGDDRVALRIAEAVLEHSVGTADRLALSLAGGPARLLRMVAKAGAKFSSVADLRTLRVTSGRASVEYRLHDGYPPNRFDCDYTRGLLIQSPVVFDLPPAAVNHTSCQVRGAATCRYEVKWQQPRARWLPWLRGTRRDGALETAMLGQLEQLQNTVAALVAARDPALALATVADGAGYAVNAHAFLLMARPSADEPIQVHSFGLSEAEVASYTRGPVTGLRATGQLTARIASAQHDYGHLIAFGDNFFDSDPKLLDAYANLAAVTLDTLSAVTTAAARQRTAENLLALSSALTRAQSREEVADVTVKAAHAIMSAERASVLLLDNDGAMRITAHVGWPPEFADRLNAFTVTSADTDYLTRILEQPEVPQLHDRSTEDPFIRAVLDMFELDSMVIVGIALPHRRYGMIVASFDGPHGLARGQRFAVDIAGAANQAATVLHGLELLEQTWRQAHRDPLTGIPNRRAFMTALEEAVTGDGALLFIDLDGFKSVNDTLGHAAGDRLLTVVAERLSASIRGGDLLARLAGDEFVVLAKDVRGAAELTLLTDRVMAAFREPVLLGDTSTPVRASIGTALFTAGQDCEDVLHRADSAMYEAKRKSSLRRSRSDPAHLNASTENLTTRDPGAPA
ncbi:diguanylate cyclase (GGDEF) domain-containing protein [Micromonospora pattaloongensis]|uniref:Diguanylate cyclase (GGDEF) domain-containing protein n=1 Tax=Micromonospora pattaloongensis TaxID=405436 RepID=A0A1H3NW83_9ACTN|nr:GGDEF domain-containing protein [Micromonospora pattaloongensis]SDY93108.1 diguanylate cyclase (GGDEF) domain-containing protein [Micromonospora pattaloongensis]